MEIILPPEHAGGLRILLLAGQHGDEIEAVTAVRNFLASRQAREFGDQQVGIAAMPCVNPSAHSRQKRTGPSGIDLNRDHQLLDAGETRAVHQAVSTWKPHLVIDVHTYPPRRSHFLSRGLVHCQDVFIDVPTHPSVRCPIAPIAFLDLVESTKSALASEGFRASRYLIVTASGEVRHSTTDIVDARNGIALRHQIPTILLEGRGFSKKDDARDPARTSAALEHALHAVISWANRNAAALTRPMLLPQAGDETALRCRYAPGDSPCILEMRDAATGAIREIVFEEPFLPGVTTTLATRLPKAYAVPRALTWTRSVLSRHAFLSFPSEEAGMLAIENQRIASIRREPRRGRGSWKLELDSHFAAAALEGYDLFPVAQRGGHALAAFLEPHSRYSLLRFPDAGLTPRPGADHPVFRVHSCPEPAALDHSGNQKPELQPASAK
ncbi:MAG: hypothetical protein ACRCXD_05750 [Luteolibacter sp.]